MTDICYIINWYLLYYDKSDFLMIVFSGIWEWSKEQLGLNKCTCLISDRIRIVQNQKYFLFILGQNKSYFFNKF